MTLAAIRDTLYRKSHRACRGKAPPSCLRKTALPLKSPTGAFIATQTRSCRKVQNGEDLFPMKIFTAPQHTRSILPLTSSDKIIAALRGRYFFTNRTLCGCTSLWNLFLVVDCTTSKCYSCAWKKPNVVSALRLAFFILNLESFISRLNVIPCHDLTLSVSEPDNAAAQTGAGTSFGANGDPITWAEPRYLFFAS